MHNQINVKTFNVLQNIVVVGFAIFNLILAFNLFHSFAENEALKWVYSGVGILWDAALLITLVLLKTAIRHRKGKAAVGYGFAYIVLLTLGAIGAIGFNIASAENQSKSVEAKSRTSAIANTTTDSNLTAIKLHQENAARHLLSAKALSEKKYDSTAPGYEWYINKQASDIEALSNKASAELEKAEKLSAKIEESNLSITPEVKEIASNDIFKAVGDIVGLQSEKVRSFVFILFIVMVHVVLFANAPVLNTKVKIDAVNRKSVETFIDALFEVPGTRLATDDTIIAKTGLSEKEAKSIRKFLLDLPSWRGQPVLVTGKGIGTKSNVNKDTLKTLVRVNLESGE